MKNDSSPPSLFDVPSLEDIVLNYRKMVEIIPHKSSRVCTQMMLLTLVFHS
jgi:hypothetical protein